MTTLDFEIYSCGTCGVLMVGGALWLLGRGVIKLSEAAQGASGLTVELEQKIKDIERKLKISSSYPTIALFIIGFFFIALGLYYAPRPPPELPVQTFKIVGKLPIDDPSSVTVMVANVANNFTPDSNGEIDRNVDFSPEVRQLTLIVNAAGYSPAQSLFTLNVDKDAKQKQFGFPQGLKFTKVAEKPTAPGSVIAVPANIKLQALNQPPGF